MARRAAAKMGSGRFARLYYFAAGRWANARAPVWLCVLCGPLAIMLIRPLTSSSLQLLRPKESSGSRECSRRSGREKMELTFLEQIRIASEPSLRDRFCRSRWLLGHDYGLDFDWILAIWIRVRLGAFSTKHAEGVCFTSRLAMSLVRRRFSD